MSAAGWSCFAGHRRLATGTLAQAAVAALEAGTHGDPVLVFDDATGRVVDLDLRGDAAAVAARYAGPAAPGDDGPAEKRARGRPKLGVIAREVTLLPRHWDWLAAQPGGASVALRRIVDEARRLGGPQERDREARDSAYRFMHALGGDLPGFEEASRALFANYRARLEQVTAGWPADVRDHVLRLAFPAAG